MSPDWHFDELLMKSSSSRGGCELRLNGQQQQLRLGFQLLDLSADAQASSELQVHMSSVCYEESYYDIHIHEEIHF